MYNSDLFLGLSGNGSFHRVDEAHPLDLYIGLDATSRHTLFLISDSEPEAMLSSQIINVSVGLRKDKRWAISFALVDDHFEDIFVHFCNDIIESSRSLKDKLSGAEFVSNRYAKWQSMLAKSNGDLLSASIVKGLVGELSFLKDFLIPLYGQSVAVKSWIGPEKADQDFVCGDTWYEVKATVSGAESVKISSVEQLDMPLVGELAIVYLDKTSNSDSTKITLNSIYTEVYDSLESEELKNKLSGILLNLGYYVRPEYNEPSYKLSRIARYSVDSNFPCIRRNEIPKAIVNSQYVLSLSSISVYLKDK